MDDCSKDVISGLPEALICHILSFLTTKEAASTSVLAKRWRYLFAYTPNLDFDEFSSLESGFFLVDENFMSFVDRVLKLRGGKYKVDKFSLKCGEDVWGFVVSYWILEVLRLGVSDLTLLLSSQLLSPLPSEVFESETLVRLKIGPGYGSEYGPRIDLKKVCLPKLETLVLDTAEFEEGRIGFAKLLSGCPVLEELVLPNLKWYYWDSCSVSSITLKRLTICCAGYDENQNSVAFDTPNVVYLEYTDYMAGNYPIVNFDSLLEASIGIRMTDDQKATMRNASDGDEETEFVGNATVLLEGICNVKTLYLSYQTLETLNFCCEAIPVFNNLTHLTIDSHHPEVGWGSLPDLLKNCPNLETLVFQGFHHKPTNRCGDVCLCRDLEKSPSSLSQCPVKFLTILNFGEAFDSDDEDEELEMEFETIKHFLKKMPNLEQLIIYYNSPVDNWLAEVSSQLQKVEEIASTKCKIQVISDNICFSCTVPSSLLMKFGLLLL